MAITQIRLDTQAQDATLTPAKITAAAVDFTFGQDVIATRDIIANVKVSTDSLKGKTGNLIISPFANSTSALRFTKADGTTIVASIDTTNNTLDMNSHKIVNLLDPVSDQDAATKAYVDSISAGLDPKKSVRVATLVAGTLASDFEDGDTVDGVTLATGDRILIKNQADAKQNGIYTVNASGAPTRSTDMDGTPANEVSGGNYTFVEAGSQAGSGWVVVHDGDISLGVDDINWTQFSDSGTIIAGAGLTKTVNTLDIVSANTGITVNSDDIALNLNSTSGLEISSGLRIKSDTATANTIGVTITSNGAGVKFDSNSFTDSGSETLALASGVAGDGLALTSGVLSVNVDNSSIEINSDSLRVKAAGVTYAMSNMVTRETPSGTINGSNVTFTLANSAAAGSEQVFLNGILQDAGSGNDYTISGATITFEAGNAPISGSKLRVTYWKA